MSTTIGSRMTILWETYVSVREETVALNLGVMRSPRLASKHLQSNSVITSRRGLNILYLC